MRPNRAARSMVGGAILLLIALWYVPAQGQTPTPTPTPTATPCGTANGCVTAPSDLSGQNNFDGDFWANVQSNSLGEQVALRVEVVELRRMVLLVGGVAVGVMLMRWLFDGVSR